MRWCLVLAYALLDDINEDSGKYDKHIFMFETDIFANLLCPFVTKLNDGHVDYGQD